MLVIQSSNSLEFPRLSDFSDAKADVNDQNEVTCLYEYVSYDLLGWRKA